MEWHGMSRDVVLVRMDGWTDEEKGAFARVIANKSVMKLVRTTLLSCASLSLSCPPPPPPLIR